MRLPRLLAALVLSSACGGGAAPSSPPPESPPPATSAAPSAPPSGAAPHVRGPLDPAAVQAQVRGQSEAIRACYKAGLAKNAALAGSVIVTFTVSPDGKVKDIADGGSTLPDPEVIRCIQPVFVSLHFVALTENKPAYVTYPIEFSPRK